jgi:hypothetical protein
MGGSFSERGRRGGWRKRKEGARVSSIKGSKALIVMEVGVVGISSCSPKRIPILQALVTRFLIYSVSRSVPRFSVHFATSIQSPNRDRETVTRIVLSAFFDPTRTSCDPCDSYHLGAGYIDKGGDSPLIRSKGVELAFSLFDQRRLPLFSSLILLW